VSVVSPLCERDFDALFRSGYRRLARLLYRVTGDYARAEEVASEAFWRLHLKPPPLDTNLEGWLYRTGLRLALDHLKKERRRSRYESLAAVLRLADQPSAPSGERDRVRAVLAALKPAHTGLILLRAEGFSYAEAATALALNPASVGTLLARAEAAFRKEYVRRYGIPKGAQS
jgi:RNA polymerase sigma-70 factor (ECF subfamily)